MPLEDLIIAHTKALDRNSAALEAILANKPAAAPQGAAAPGAGKSADAGKANAPGQTKAPGTAATGKGAGKTKAASEDDLRNAFGAYLSVKDKDEREARKANVKAILDHFGASKATELPKENWADAIAYIKQFEAGETPNFMNEDGGEGGGDEGDSLI